MAYFVGLFGFVISLFVDGYFVSFVVGLFVGYFNGYFVGFIRFVIGLFVGLFVGFFDGYFIDFSVVDVVVVSTCSLVSSGRLCIGNSFERFSWSRLIIR